MRRVFGFHYKVLFIVRDGARLRQRGKNHARMGHFARDRFVTEVETEPVVRRPADDPGEQRRCRQKIEIRHRCPVTGIPQHTGPRAALDVATTRVKRKRRRPSRHHARHRQPRGEQFCAQVCHRRISPLAGRATLRSVALMQLSVVGVQTAGANAGQRTHRLIQRRRFRPGRDARARLADIEVEQDFRHDARRGRRAAQRRQRLRRVRQRRELRRRKCPHQLKKAPDVRPHRLQREQHVSSSSRRREFRFGDGRTLEFCDPQGQLANDELRELVRLDVRTKEDWVADPRDHPP